MLYIYIYIYIFQSESILSQQAPSCTHPHPLREEVSNIRRISLKQITEILTFGFSGYESRQTDVSRGMPHDGFVARFEVQGILNLEK